MGEKEIEKLRAELNAVYEGFSFIISKIDEIEKAAAGHIDVWDPDKIQWTQAEGPNGLYEKAGKQEGQDYSLMVQDLKQHQKRLTKDGLFYWLFDNQETVGRKSRKKSQGTESEHR